MADPQGLMTYDGISQVLHAVFPFSAHGIEPSICTIDIVPQVEPILTGGTLVLSYGGYPIAFPGCCVDSGSYRYDRNGYIVSVAIKDRRWKWKYGSISGRYNVRSEDGALLPQYQRSARQLAELLLTAAGEARPDVSKMPATVYPYVEWDCANPMAALEDLCQELRMRIVLDLTNTVRLWPLGEGQLLPDGPDVLEKQLTVDPQDVPAAIEVCGGFTRVQARLDLEPVGYETQGPDAGKLVHIDQLSYNPEGQGQPNGWAGQTPEFLGVENEANRAMAVRCVWRMYRVVITPGEIPNVGTVLGLEQILPLLPYLNESWTGAPNRDGGKQKQEPRVVGEFWLEDLGAGENTDGETAYPGQFFLNEATGVVTFPSALVKLDDDEEFTHADIDLVCAFGFRSSTTGARNHFAYTRPTGSQVPTGPLVLHRPELIPEVTGTRTADGEHTWSTNDIDGLIAAAEQWIAAVIAGYGIGIGGAGKYIGFKSLNPDGRLMQLVFVTGEEGCYTIAGLGFEVHPFLLPYQRRMDRALKTYQIEQEKAARRHDRIQRRERADA